MPTISIFYGILIRMFNTNEHNPPHFHACYQEYEALFDLEGNLIEREMPNRQIKLIAAWAELHKDELEANWRLAEEHEQLFNIEPLR